jgi:threonine dehydratase
MPGLSFRAIREARKFLQEYLRVTRLVEAPSLSKLTGANVFLKLESELSPGSDFDIAAKHRPSPAGIDPL